MTSKIKISDTIWFKQDVEQKAKVVAYGREEYGEPTYIVKVGNEEKIVYTYQIF